MKLLIFKNITYYNWIKIESSIMSTEWGQNNKISKYEELWYLSILSNGKESDRMVYQVRCVMWLDYGIPGMVDRHTTTTGE